MQDGVGIDLRQGLHRVADAGRDLCIPFEAADHERQGGATHWRKNLGVFVFRDMARADQSRHRHRGIGDAAQPVGEAEIVHSCVASIEAWMNVDDRASLVRRMPERIEVGVVQSAADAARQRADHRAGKSRSHRCLQHAGCARAVAKRHGRERHEMRLRLGRGKQTIIGEPAPRLGFGAGQLIAEHIDPTADDLAVDALLGHPGEPRRYIG